MIIGVIVKKFFRWVFSFELQNLIFQTQMAEDVRSRCEDQWKKVESMLQNIDISVDVHEYKHSSSWAVISLQGQKTDYIKFIEMKDSDVREISQFLRKYERNAHIKIDASPSASQFLRIEHNLPPYQNRG